MNLITFATNLPWTNQFNIGIDDDVTNHNAGALFRELVWGNLKS